jgi:hypothetical protein
VEQAPRQCSPPPLAHPSPSWVCAGQGVCLAACAAYSAPCECLEACVCRCRNLTDSDPALQIAALEASYRDGPALGAPAHLAAGRVRSAASAAPPPPGSLLAEPLSLARHGLDSWQARFRCGLAALLLQPVDFSGNPSLPEALHAYGTPLDAAKGDFQLAAVAAACLAAASASRSAAGAAPLSHAAATALLERLTVVHESSRAPKTW